MPRPPQDVTDAELAVLEVLWTQGPSSRRQIADVLYPGGQPAHYTTVQKLLERLESKGHVACRAETPVRTVGATALALAAAGVALVCRRPALVHALWLLVLLKLLCPPLWPVPISAPAPEPQPAAVEPALSALLPVFPDEDPQPEATVDPVIL